MKITGLVIALVQLVDIALHAATNQLEPLRVSSNLVILLWLAISLFGRLGDKFRPVLGTGTAFARWLALAFPGTYLLLNLVFLALEGVTNPEQGGALRITLFGLVTLTTALSGWFTYLREKSILPIGK